MIHLIPLQRQQLKLSKPVAKTSKQWANGVVDTLQTCLECTNSLDECTDTVTSYVSFCEDICIRLCTRVCYNNNKPWFTSRVKRENEEAFRSGDGDIFRALKNTFSRAVRETKLHHSMKL